MTGEEGDVGYQLLRHYALITDEHLAGVSRLLFYLLAPAATGDLMLLNPPPAVRCSMAEENMLRREFGPGNLAAVARPSSFADLLHHAACIALQPHRHAQRTFGHQSPIADTLVRIGV